MSGSKISRFIKKRYFIAPEGADSVLAKEVVKDEEAVKSEAKEAVESNSKPVTKPVPSTKPEPKPEPEPKPGPKPEPKPVVEKVAEENPELISYEKANKGRTYGWWVYLDGHRVASLEYRCRLDEVVHLYSVNVLDDKFLRIDLDSEKWLGSNVTFQSRYAGSYIKQGLSMAAVGQKMIVVEGLKIPEEHFHRQYAELKEFHQKLLDKANSRSSRDAS